MRVIIKGGGWYGCHIAATLLADGHDVTLYEKSGSLFSGASGSIPARIHRGYHYPRSGDTRDACLRHMLQFEKFYAAMMRYPKTNIYAVAAHESLVDFTCFKEVCAKIPDTTFHAPDERRELRNIDGFALTGEGHVLINAVRGYFEGLLADRVVYNVDDPPVPAGAMCIDCTFCAVHNVGVQRYEPCVTFLVEGPTDFALTIMDGQFPSLYPWDEVMGLCSVTSAKWTPLARVASYDEARAILANADSDLIAKHWDGMSSQVAHFYPEFLGHYRYVEPRFGIRAMPSSAADTRLMNVAAIDGTTLAIRAGKIDAVFETADIVRKTLTLLRSQA